MRLPEALTRALNNIQVGRVPQTPLGQVRYVGGNAVMATLLAGTTNKKSTAYKTQLRNVERWLKGTRKPSEGSRAKMAAAAQQEAARRALSNLRRRGVVVDFSGTVLVSRDERFREIRGVQLSGEAMQQILDLWQQGERAEAAEAFQELFFEAYAAYAMAGAVITDVEELTFFA